MEPDPILPRVRLIAWHWPEYGTGASVDSCAFCLFAASRLTCCLQAWVPYFKGVCSETYSWKRFLRCVLCTGAHSRVGCGSQVSREGRKQELKVESVGTAALGVNQLRLTTG